MQFVFCSEAPALLTSLPLYIFKAKVRQTSVLEHSIRQVLPLVFGIPFSPLIGQYHLIPQPFTDRTPTSRPREENHRKKICFNQNVILEQAG